MPQSRSIASTIAAAITLLFGSTSSFGQAPPPLTVPPAQTFPNEDIALTSHHLNRAREIAGAALYPHFMRRCVLPHVYSAYANSAEAPQQMAPTQALDTLYVIGQGADSAWAVQ